MQVNLNTLHWTLKKTCRVGVGPGYRTSTTGSIPQAFPGLKYRNLRGYPRKTGQQGMILESDSLPDRASSISCKMYNAASGICTGPFPSFWSTILFPLSLTWSVCLCLSLHWDFEGRSCIRRLVRNKEVSQMCHSRKAREPLQEHSKCDP